MLRGRSLSWGMQAEALRCLPTCLRRKRCCVGSDGDGDGYIDGCGGGSCAVEAMLLARAPSPSSPPLQPASLS